MSKSHVSMEQKQCRVCGTVYDSGAILLQKNLKQTLERNTVTGYGLCPEHQELYDKGYIALVEATTPYTRPSLKQEDAIRTGQICHLHRAAANDIFNIELDSKLPMVFVEPGVIKKIQAMIEKEAE